MSRSRRALVAIALFSVAGMALAADAVRGSGTVVAQPRELGAFSGVALGGPFELVLRRGTREAVEVRADDTIVPLVETRIETNAGGRRSLTADLRRGARLAPSTRVVVTVDFVHLDELSLGGGGEISGSGLRSEALEVSITGSGEVVHEGSAQPRTTVVGSGTVRRGV